MNDLSRARELTRAQRARLSYTALFGPDQKARGFHDSMLTYVRGRLASLLGIRSNLFTYVHSQTDGKDHSSASLRNGGNISVYLQPRQSTKSAVTFPQCRLGQFLFFQDPAFM